MRVLLTGVNGMLAHALVATAPPHVEIVGRTRAQLDVGDAASIERDLDTVEPAIVLNTAAYTAVDRAESDVEAAERVNGVAPGLLGAAAARADVKIVHFSTDHVFDGTQRGPYSEDDRTNPINAYGRSKLNGERALRESGARHLIVRTQWLFGETGRSFPSTMWSRARDGAATRVVGDQAGVPTFTVDLARATWSLLDQDGIIHIVSEGATTWFGAAQRIFATAERPELLTPCSTREYRVAARRPANAVLATTRLRALGMALPHWTDALDRYLAALIAAEK